jgi:hypothetical protein
MKEIGVLIDKNGKIYPGYILNDSNHRIMKSLSAKMSSDDLHVMKGAIKIEFEKDALFSYDDNFALIYGGINSVSLGITYREFTLEDMARTSFYQNIVYETSAKQIRFKNIIFDVIEATNEKIVYKVISDGLTDSYYPRFDVPDKFDTVYDNCESRVSKSRK